MDYRVVSQKEREAVFGKVNETMDMDVFSKCCTP
jgi:hypothetical protein